MVPVAELDKRCASLALHACRHAGRVSTFCIDAESFLKYDRVDTTACDAEWSERDIETLQLFAPVSGGNACLAASAFLHKTCAQVHAQLGRMGLLTDAVLDAVDPLRSIPARSAGTPASALPDDESVPSTSAAAAAAQQSSGKDSQSLDLTPSDAQQSVSAARTPGSLTGGEEAASAPDQELRQTPKRRKRSLTLTGAGTGYDSLSQAPLKTLSRCFAVAHLPV